MENVLSIKINISTMQGKQREGLTKRLISHSSNLIATQASGPDAFIVRETFKIAPRVNDSEVPI